MNYWDAIDQADHFDLEVTGEDGVTSTTRIYSHGKKLWLDMSNSFYKSDDFVACKVWAVQAGGLRVLVSEWSKARSELTDAERAAGRMAFTDDLTIKAVSGER